MPEDFYIKLTLGVHQVASLFPEKEPLKYDIKKLANEILVSLLCNNYKGLSDNIKLIQNLFNLAESHDWVDPRNFSVLRREYDKISRFPQVKGVSSGKPVEKSFRRPKRRKEEILEILKANGKIKIGELARSFPGLNRRTLLRDLDGFCQLGLAEKNGNGRGACYTIRNATL